MAVLTRVCFRGGSVGEWRVLRMQTLAGPPLEPVSSLNRQERPGPAAAGAVWSLHGVTSHQRLCRRAAATARLGFHCIAAFYPNFALGGRSIGLTRGGQPLKSGALSTVLDD